MSEHGHLISTAEEIQALAAELRAVDTIAFDTEFIRENTFYPIVELIQVATDKKAWLVDAQVFKKRFRQGPQGGHDPAIEPLLDVFRDPKILKIVHAAQGDQECLYTSFACVAKSTFDTSVGASLCGFGDAVGLGKLLKSVLNITIGKGHARTNWSVRPLPKQLQDYALADVESLVELGRRLLAELDKRGRRDWGMALSAKYEDTAQYESAPQAMAERLAKGGRLDAKGYAALCELMVWREKRVRDLNLPRRWVADDAVLLDLAQVRPKDVGHLGAFRGLNKGEVKSSGEAILAALRKAESEGPKAPLARGPRPVVPTAEESQMLDVLRCYIGILAEQHGIAAKYITTTAQLTPIVRERVESPDDLVKAGILSAEAAALIGQEIVNLIHGKRALALRDNRVRIVDVRD